MARYDITSVTWNTTPSANQTCTVAYRLASDPDVPASYITVDNAVVVEPSGNLPVPCAITGLSPATNYVAWGYNNCGDEGFKQPFTTLAPSCPPGYTLSPDGTYCYQEDQQPAENTGGGSPYTVCRNVNDVYSTFPTRIMKVNGYDLSGVPLAGAGFVPTNLDVAPFWFNTPSGGHGNTTDGPVNRLGIWACLPGGTPCATNCPPVGTPIGFSRQFNVPVTGIYYIGLGADNYMTVSLQDGVGGLRTIVQQNPDAIGDYFGLQVDVTFKSFLIYPVQLYAGPNILTLSGTNDGSAAVMACEIYNNTEAELVAATAIADLDIIFSTDVNQPFIEAGENFDTGNWNCDAHPGYSLVYDPDTDAYSCVKINTTPPIV